MNRTGIAFIILFIGICTALWIGIVRFVPIQRIHIAIPFAAKNQKLTPTPWFTEAVPTLSEKETATMSGNFVSEFESALASAASEQAAAADQAAALGASTTAQTPAPTGSKDTIAPAVEIRGGPAEGSTLSDTKACFPLWVSDNLTLWQSLVVHVKLDNGKWSDWSANLGPCLENLGNGGHVFGVQVKDGAGNISPEIRRTFTTK